MIKNYGFLKRKNGLTREQFLEHWENVHAPLVVASNIPRVKKYIQNHPVKSTGFDMEYEIDGIAEFWFEDLKSIASFRQWLRSPNSKPLREDGQLFIDFSLRGHSFLAEEHVIIE